MWNILLGALRLRKAQQSFILAGLLWDNSLGNSLFRPLNEISPFLYFFLYFLFHTSSVFLLKTHFILHFLFYQFSSLSVSFIFFSLSSLSSFFPFLFIIYFFFPNPSEMVQKYSNTLKKFWIHLIFYEVKIFIGKDLNVYFLTFF